MTNQTPFKVPVQPTGGASRRVSPGKPAARSEAARSLKAPVKSEHAEQVRVVRAIRERGVPNLYWFAVPNAAKRSFQLAEHMKAEGLKDGVQDLIFSIPPNARMGCLEMKKRKGGVISDAQRMREREAKQSGALHAYAPGAEIAIKVLEEWGVLRDA